MKLIVAALFDRKAERFLRPIFAPTLGVVYRDLGDEMVRNAESPILAHAEDFDLYQLGVFDDEEGKLDVLSSPSLLTNVAALRVSPGVSAKA